ncbi:hypothetical protein GGR54DRAFT_526085 [Hypoxylon sp. NC1633]|nr:hypothetical protein GGR54DRAFT_526085 [Hypoxylon sp. NC1633]
MEIGHVYDEEGGEVCRCVDTVGVHCIEDACNLARLSCSTCCMRCMEQDRMTFSKPAVFNLTWPPFFALFFSFILTMRYEVSTCTSYCVGFSLPYSIASIASIASCVGRYSTYTYLPINGTC